MFLVAVDHRSENRGADVGQHSDPLFRLNLTAAANAEERQRATVFGYYVTDPERLLPYLRGPNWDASGVEYAHYRQTVSFYGKELLEQ